MEALKRSAVSSSSMGAPSHPNRAVPALYTLQLARHNHLHRYVQLHLQQQRGPKLLQAQA